MDIYNINKVISIMKENIKSRFSSKGKKIIDINNKVVDNSLKYLKRVSIDSSWVNLEYSDNKKLNFNETINLLKGDTLPVSSFLDVSNGVFEGGLLRMKREILLSRFLTGYLKIVLNVINVLLLSSWCY
mgnify:CR=1 FL=1